MVDNLTTLAECAHRFDQLCRSDPIRVEARRFVAEFQVAHDEDTKGESEWAKQRRIYFEETALTDDELLDDTSHYKDSDLRWESYERGVYVSEVEGLPHNVGTGYFHELPDNYYHGDTRPPERQPAGDIKILAWTPAEFLECNGPKPLSPLPPKNIQREYRLFEIVTALVAIHDADGRFEPIVSEDDPICKHWLFRTFLLGSAKDEGKDDWAPGLEPLLEKVEAEWRGLAEINDHRTIVSDDEDDPAGTNGSPGPASKTPKRSTESGEARVKIISALTKHHKYSDGSCLNQEPIGNNELARQAEVSDSTASEFFKKEFNGHSKYKVLCMKNGSELITSLKLLNQEFSPHHLFGRKPPGENDNEDEL